MAGPPPGAGGGLPLPLLCLVRRGAPPGLDRWGGRRGGGARRGLVPRPRLPHGRHQRRLPELCPAVPLRRRLPRLEPGCLRVRSRCAPADCRALHARARSLLVSALDYLDIDPARWLAADLPLPDAPPHTGSPGPTTEGGMRDGPLRTA